MRIKSFFPAVCGVVALATASPAEQRLSDIAGTIELQRPEGERLVVVEPGPELPGARINVGGDDLVEMTSRLLASGRDASNLLQETRTSLAFFDDGWRQRMSATLEDLDAARVELEVCNPAARYRDSVAGILDGARQYQIAAGIVRWAMLRDQAILSEAIEHLNAGHRQVVGALVRLRDEVRREISESESAPPDELGSGRTVSQICGSLYRTDASGEYDRCVASQRAALESMRRRFGFSVGLDEASFNSIRRRCLDEWPNDLIARDRCERRLISDAVQ